MNYTFNKIKNIDYENLLTVYKIRQPDVFTLTHKSISYHSPFNDLFFIHKYISDCLTKYEIFLEKDENFKNREDVQKYVDIVSTLSSCVVKFYLENNFDLSETLIYFIKQFLTFVFKNTKFVVINIASMDNKAMNSLTKFKLLIEPVIVSENNRVDCKDEKTIHRVAEMLFLLTSYLESEQSSVSSTLIKSKYWIKGYDKFPELIDDGMYLNLFEREPELYKRVFRMRDTLIKEEFDFVNDDIRIIEELSHSDTSIFSNNDIFSEQNEEIKSLIESINAENENKDLGMFIEIFYSKMFPPAFRKFEIDKIKFDTPQLPMYSKVNSEKNLNIIFKDYLRKIFDKVYKKRKPTNIQDMSFILPPLEIETIVDGYKKFVYDNHDNKTINSVKDFIFYVSENIKDYVSLSSRKIDSVFVDKLINSYKKTEVEVKDIDSLEDKIKLECSLDGQNYRFTFSKKDGIINNIEYRKDD